MRLIDADALRKDVLALPNCDNGFSDTYDKSLIIGLIDEQNVIDAVPVVRCEYCAKSRPDENDDSVWLWCRRVHGLTRKNDFCSYGERKDDEE